ncbi:MAG: hypothetical protein U0175_05335 [Caldilineaceae bacterium]
MSTFLLEFWTEKNDFCIYAEADDYEKELTLEGEAKSILAQFNTIYEILQEIKTHDVKVLESTIQTLSARLLTPFAAQIKVCDLLRIIVYEDVVRCAFDLLHFEGAPLFLQRPICYQVDEGEGEDNPTIELGSALLIADLTADPEEACRSVAKLLPDAQYAEMKNASMRMIQDAASELDVLVISAHGDIDEESRGGLYLNDETLRAGLVGKLEAWVVYFDSCQQGANMTYLDAFQEESDTQYYLAPIVSNDAGDSSTNTMIWFFTALLRHKNPIRALFETRKRLYEFYHDQKKLNLVTALNKAFVFRLYEFVG